MANIALVYKTVADQATLATSGGTTWNSDLPLTNMLDRRLSKVARATSLGTGTQMAAFTIDLGAFDPLDLATYRAYDAIALVNHSLSPKAKVSIKSSSDPTFATGVGLDLVDDLVYKVSLANVDWNWSHPKFYSKRLSEIDLYGFTRVYYHPMAVAQCNSDRGTLNSNGRYLRITVTDEYNESQRNYIEIGRLFIGKRFTTRFNMARNSALRYEDTSIVESSIGGELFADRRNKKRILTFKHGLLNKAEALSGALDIQRIAGTTEEVLVMTDYEDTAYGFKKDFLGRFTKLNDVVNWHCDRYSTDYEIEEIL